LRKRKHLVLLLTLVLLLDLQPLAHGPRVGVILCDAVANLVLLAIFLVVFRSSGGRLKGLAAPSPRSSSVRTGPQDAGSAALLRLDRVSGPQHENDARNDLAIDIPKMGEVIICHPWLDVKDFVRPEFAGKDFGPSSPTRKLMQLRAIGPHSAWVCVLELFGWRRVHNRRQLASLVGLTAFLLRRRKPRSWPNSKQPARYM
jgi:hypothetical protein